MARLADSVLTLPSLSSTRFYPFKSTRIMLINDGPRALLSTQRYWRGSSELVTHTFSCFSPVLMCLMLILGNVISCGEDSHYQHGKYYLNLILLVCLWGETNRRGGVRCSGFNAWKAFMWSADGTARPRWGPGPGPGLGYSWGRPALQET